MAADLLVREVGSYLDELGPNRPPDNDSDAARDARTLAYRESTETINGMASMLMESAADHHYALVRVLEAPAMAIAPYTLARAVLESSAHVLWLLEPRLDPFERLARSLSVRFKGLEAQAKLLRAAKDTDKLLTTLSRCRELAALADSRGLPVSRRKAGDIAFIGMKTPTATDLAKKYLAGEVIWRVLSSVAHGDPATLMRASFRLAAPNLVEKHLSADAAATLMVHSARWFARCAWAYLGYSGWTGTRLSGILEHVYDGMLLDEDVRFWRPSPVAKSSNAQPKI
jgi:hypothetical protein